MAQGGGAKPKKKQALKKKTVVVHSKRLRTRVGTTRASAKHVIRDKQTKDINKSIERLTAGRAARAGGNLEITTLDTMSKHSCAELRKAAAESKKITKKNRQTQAPGTMPVQKKVTKEKSSE